MDTSKEQQVETKGKVDFYIQLAKWLLEEGNLEQSERVYRTAVAIARRESGEDSGIVGCALIELWFFYDTQEREEEAAGVWRELVEVVRARYTELMDPSYG